MSATLLSPMLPLLQTADPQLPPTGFGTWLIFTLIKLLVLFTIYMVGVALLTFIERRVCAWIQDRHGPNRVGPQGILQAAADGLKNIMKEETQPRAAYRVLFNLAPALAFIPALSTWAVIPYAAPLPTRWGRFDFQLADLPVGFLFVLALTSLGVYGIVLAGWSSNNKYALLGGLRSSAQMISYEISMGMATIPVLLLAGNVTLGTIVAQQAVLGWNVATLTIASLLFMVAAFAETNRLPFDLPEAESELVAGYHSEYSAMKFSFFFIAEYANMATASAMIATLFVFGLKIAFFIFLFMWIRWTLPRFRYDQLMALGWKVMLPIAITYIMIVAGAVLALDYYRVPRDWHFGLALLGMNVVLVLLLAFLLDRGRLVSPAGGRASPQEIARLREASRRSALTRAEAQRVGAHASEPTPAAGD